MLAVEGESVRKDLKTRKSYMNYLAVKDLAEGENLDVEKADPVSLWTSMKRRKKSLQHFPALQ